MPRNLPAALRAVLTPERLVRLRTVWELFNICVLGLNSFLVLCYHTTSDAGLGRAALSGAAGYALTLLVQLAHFGRRPARMRAFRLTRKVFRLLYTALYITSIMIDVCALDPAEQTVPLLGWYAARLVWAALWGTNCFWLGKAAQAVRRLAMPHKRKSIEEDRPNATLNAGLTQSKPSPNKALVLYRHSKGSKSPPLRHLLCDKTKPKQKENTTMKVSEIKYPTPIEKDVEKAIRDRLFNGFNNWNGGYDGWLEWCNTLYEPDAYYNIPLRGTQKRLTLQEYKDMMGQLFQHFTMDLGQFENMIIRDDWCAIRYTVKIKNLHTGEEFLQNTMEFVKFKMNPDPIGARVVEGWALSDLAIS